MNRWEEIADYAENHDFSAEMDSGTCESDVDPDPMVSTSLRLPKSLLDWVREQATAQHSKPTTYIRQLLEEARATNSAPTDVATRLDRLERAVFPTPASTEYVDR